MLYHVDDDYSEDSSQKAYSKRWKAVGALVFLLVAIAGGAGFSYWYTRGGAFSSETEELIESLPIDAFVETSIVPLEPMFSGFEVIAAKKNWTRIGRADPAAELEMTVALTLQNVDRLEQRVLAAATPSSPHYGKWLTLDEVHELTSPSPSTVQTVVDWHGATLDDYHPGGFIKRVVTVAEAEKLLHSEYHVFEHTSGKQVIRMISGYSVDSEVAPYISFVSPSVRLPARTEMESSLIYSEMEADENGDPIPAEMDTAPEYLRTLYGITDTGSAAGNKQAVAEFLTQIFFQSDQDKFYNRFYPRGAGTKIEMKGHSVIQKGDYAGIETMLDTEYITVTGTGIETENWSYMFDPALPRGMTCPFLDWILDIGSTDDSVIPKVFSVSYGDDESDVGPTYASRINTEFMKAAARGISILFASGDSGANCVGTEFVPDFPGSLPYVTTVGGTRGDREHEIDTWRLSGGGFSSLFDRPSWQDDMVSKYLQIDGVKESASKRNVNLRGRAYPDVSAMAVGYPVVCTGVAYLVSGTSCATPVFAGIIALLNDYLIQNGKPTLGFLNPWLYSTAGNAFVDVTDDYNEGCSPIGWHAAEGWDPVTGLGYPDYGSLKELLD